MIMNPCLMTATFFIGVSFGMVICYIMLETINRKRKNK